MTGARLLALAGVLPGNGPAVLQLVAQHTASGHAALPGCSGRYKLRKQRE
jgi:hypothetical protein